MDLRQEWLLEGGERRKRQLFRKASHASHTTEDSGIYSADSLHGMHCFTYYQSNNHCRTQLLQSFY